MTDTPTTVSKEAPDLTKLWVYLQAIADEHADVLRPKQIEILYEAAAYLHDHAARQALSSKGEWRDISGAPKDGTHLLLWDGFAVFEGFNNWSMKDGKRFDSWQTISLSPRPWVSHWMPLPAPPAESREGERG